MTLYVRSLCKAWRWKDLNKGAGALGGVGSAFSKVFQGWSNMKHVNRQNPIF